MNPIEIKSLKTDAAKQATRLLAKSFIDNPVSVHVFDDFTPEKRENKLYELNGTRLVLTLGAYSIKHEIIWSGVTH